MILHTRKCFNTDYRYHNNSKLSKCMDKNIVKPSLNHQDWWLKGGGKNK